MVKSLIRRKLESYVKKYFKAHPGVKLVVVTGSVGKTSTKIAIATLLSEKFRVRLHEGNHNAALSSPLAILGIEYPKELRNPFAWSSVFKAAKLRINQPTDVDVIIQELGTDRIGEIPHFGKYLKPDICVVSAVSPEHMEFFRTIENVAKEELSAVNFSKMAIINKDDIDESYLKYIKNSNTNTYGTSDGSDYRFFATDYSLESGYSGEFIAPEFNSSVNAQIGVLGDHSLRPIIAAGAVAAKMGLTNNEIVSGFSKIRAVPGRMSVLKGFKDTVIIDDTYNSSPLAAECALKALDDLKINTISQRIAVLGDMNELGAISDAEHEKIGKLCFPEKIEWLITVGPQSKKFTASAAKINGCRVKSFDDAISAGVFVRNIMQAGAAILFKGSQGGIFLEEAVKLVLSDVNDNEKLVRQSVEWSRKKNNFFRKAKQ